MTEAADADRLGSVVIGGRRISGRTLVFWAGVTVWLSNMIFYTGWYGLAELRASLYFVLEMIIITSATPAGGRPGVLDCWGGTMSGGLTMRDLRHKASAIYPNPADSYFATRYERSPSTF